MLLIFYSELQESYESCIFDLYGVFFLWEISLSLSLTHIYKYIFLYIYTCVYLLKAGQLGECLLGSLPVALLLLNQYLAATQHAMVASHRTHTPPPPSVNHSPLSLRLLSLSLIYLRSNPTVLRPHVSSASATQTLSASSRLRLKRESLGGVSEAEWQAR